MATTNINDNIPKPRPIKLVLESEEQKIQVLKRAKKLETGEGGRLGNGIYSPGLNSQAAGSEKTVASRDAREGGQGRRDLMIFNGKIVKRRPRPGSS